MDKIIESIGDIDERIKPPTCPAIRASPGAVISTLDSDQGTYNWFSRPYHGFH